MSRYYDDELYHHGIKGQRWGIRRFQNKDGSYTGAGKARRTTDASQSSTEKKGLSDKQKKALKIGAAAVGTALVAYGGYRIYKSGKLDSFINSGRKAAGAIDTNKSIKAIPLLTDQGSGLRKLRFPESLKDSLANANPLRGTAEGANNCSSCAIAGFLRTKGYDVVSKSTGGSQRILAGMVEDCFKGAKIMEGGASKFGRSPEDAGQMLIKKFGQNASGVCDIQWKPNSPMGRGGHAFNWEIKDGVVRFMDFQQNRDHNLVKNYWRYIDPTNYFTASCLSDPNIKIDYKKLREYIG